MNALIDPARVTNYDRTTAELELFLAFAIVVAGKTSSVQAKKLRDLMDLWRQGIHRDYHHIFGFCATNDDQFIRSGLEHVKMGQYRRLTKTFRKVADAIYIDQLRLRDVTVKQLEPLVGMKTSRFFILHTQRNAQVAALDTHILAWLRDHGIDAPSKTPTSKAKYAFLEGEYLRIAKRLRRDPTELDLEIWNSRARS